MNFSARHFRVLRFFGVRSIGRQFSAVRFLGPQFPALTRLYVFMFFIVATLGMNPAVGYAQTIRVDVTAGRGIGFDPDKALGTSMDILPAKEFDTVYSEAVIKESLSAGWGPVTYRQNTELTIDAWHWNPNGTWSNAEEKSGYFTGNAEPKDFLRRSYGYSLPHRGTTRSDAGNSNFRELRMEMKAATGKAILI
jgi:hypothetical protein